MKLPRGRYATNVHCARVFLAECRRRRDAPDYWFIFNTAQRCRREAAATRLRQRQAESTRRLLAAIESLSEYH
jgi:hypothetical protein